MARTVSLAPAVFGSGYVLLAFLRGDLVERLGWLTEKQLIDAVAVGARATISAVLRRSGPGPNS